MVQRRRPAMESARQGVQENPCEVACRVTRSRSMQEEHRSAREQTRAWATPGPSLSMDHAEGARAALVVEPVSM